LTLGRFSAVLTGTAAMLEPHRLYGYLFAFAQAFIVFWDPTTNGPVQGLQPLGGAGGGDQVVERDKDE
jgi:hypothetical protein